MVCCSVCGDSETSLHPCLDDKLIKDWQLSPFEVDYVNRQQGEMCNSCGANLRSMALAEAIRNHLDSNMVLRDLVRSRDVSSLSVLEINEAGMLTPTLRQLSGYQFAAYPEIDMHRMPFKDASFDIVIHSDTLEHIKNPVNALAECRRILKPGGALCFTVPVIVGRMTRSREGLPKSFHGDPAINADDYMVHTEFGADTWTYIMDAGFDCVSIHGVRYPDATAFKATVRKAKETRKAGLLSKIINKFR